MKANIVKGKIDIVIGIDQLYGKISNTKIISHPHKRMALLSVICGHFLGGSTQEKDDFDGGSNLSMLVSNLQMSTEPATNETTETGIQHLMNRLFTCEMPEDSNGQISADEQYAIEMFRANLKLEDGS